MLSLEADATKPIFQQPCGLRIGFGAAFRPIWLSGAPVQLRGSYRIEVVKIIHQGLRNPFRPVPRIRNLIRAVTLVTLASTYASISQTNPAFMQHATSSLKTRCSASTMVNRS